jgi:methyl-accepting chemotaxis protein
MRWLSNIRIGTKLAAMSALGILLVVGMLVSQMLGNAAVKSSNQAANQQQQIARDILAA